MTNALVVNLPAFRGDGPIGHQGDSQRRERRPTLGGRVNAPAALTISVRVRHSTRVARGWSTSPAAPDSEIDTKRQSDSLAGESGQHGSTFLFRSSCLVARLVFCSWSPKSIWQRRGCGG